MATIDREVFDKVDAFIKATVLESVEKGNGGHRGRVWTMLIAMAAISGDLIGYCYPEGVAQDVEEQLVKVLHSCIARGQGEKEQGGDDA